MDLVRWNEEKVARAAVEHDAAAGTALDPDATAQNVDGRLVVTVVMPPRDRARRVVCDAAQVLSA